MPGDLSEILSKRCSSYVDRVDADFVAKKDFYYAWSLGKGTAVVRISDYLEGAPDDVLCDFGEMIVRRAKNLQWTEPDSFMSFVCSDEYILSRRPVFIRRSRNLLRTDAGACAFLPDSVDRLMDSGLLSPSDIRNSVFSWTRTESTRRLGFCSTMFRVVGISSALDSPHVSDELRDYVVYHECLHLRQGYRPSHRVHDSEFRRWEHSFPGWADCEKRLRALHSRRRVWHPFIRHLHDPSWNSADSFSTVQTAMSSYR